MSDARSLEDFILPAWNTSAHITHQLLTSLPRPIWDAPITGAPRRTPRMIACHIHNARCMWIRTLGKPHGIPVPTAVERRSATRADLLRSLRHSATGIQRLLHLGCREGGRIPPTASYVWRNLALDVGHVLTYFVAHEAHHRGQLTLVARQLGMPLAAEARNALWQWRPPRSR